MEVKNCKTCGKQFLSETDNSYCRICNKKWYEKQEKIREQAENLKWQEQKEQERKLFEAKVQTYKPILMESVNPSAHTLYIIGNGFDLMHRVPSSYYNFRDSLGKNNSLRYSLETALTDEDIWADFENALGTLNLNLMGSRNIIDMWLDDFGVYGDEDSGAAEFYMAVEAAAAPMANLVNKVLGRVANSDQGLVMLFDLEEAIMFTPQPQEFTDPMTGEVKKKQVKFFPDIYKGRIGRSYNDYVATHQMSMFENIVSYQGDEQAQAAIMAAKNEEVEGKKEAEDVESTASAATETERIDHEINSSGPSSTQTINTEEGQNQYLYEKRGATT